jgi:excinuclease UvrABC helicase subunit UvrB
MQQTLDRKDKIIEDLRKKLRALKRYTRQLKYLAEDWAPLGQALPEILTMPPPVSLEDDDEDEYLRRQQSEIDKLKNKNRNLEEDMRKYGDRNHESKGMQAQMSQYSKNLGAQSNYNEPNRSQGF